MENIKLKFQMKYLEKNKNKPNGKLILVTAMTPTPLGEGKTTISIAIADGLKKIGKNSILALREPSLGPVFGIKRWCNRWWKSSNSTNGRHKPSFYRRYTCNNFCK